MFLYGYSAYCDGSMSIQGTGKHARHKNLFSYRKFQFSPTQFKALLYLVSRRPIFLRSRKWQDILPTDNDINVSVKRSPHPVCLVSGQSRSSAENAVSTTSPSDSHCSNESWTPHHIAKKETSCVLWCFSLAWKIRRWWIALQRLWQKPNNDRLQNNIDMIKWDLRCNERSYITT